MKRCIVCLRESEHESTRACSGEYTLCGPWEEVPTKPKTGWDFEPSWRRACKRAEESQEMAVQALEVGLAECERLRAKIIKQYESFLEDEGFP